MDSVTFSPGCDGVNATGLPQQQLLDFLFPGFSVLSAAAIKYLHIDLNLYIPLILVFSGFIFVWRYFVEYIWDLADAHLMSRVDIRIDDEVFNYIMAWVASQHFSRSARKFVANTNLNSRSWYLWRSFDDDDDENDSDGEYQQQKKKKKALSYTPSFGSYWFLYKGRLLNFHRCHNIQQAPNLPASEREEITISCFGRNPWVLKELLHEAREAYLKKDEEKTAIYRGTTRSGSTEPYWQRCMSRTVRPFSTVILNDEVKKALIDDIADYLNPATRRWYANRGIPYRRGYLLHGPPGTGKSSLSLALAGFFKMRIYIVSLNSVTANEDNLASLFAELPRRCVVLLEDIDTAGLTHTREEGAQDSATDGTENGSDTSTNTSASSSGSPKPANQNAQGRLSLSGLLNILDGVASQEGRVLIMTTNHIEKLDKALIRPGRVDMIVKFDRADESMTAQIFRAIYAPLDADEVPSTCSVPSTTSSVTPGLWWLERGTKSKTPLLTPEEKQERDAAAANLARKKEATIERVNELAEQFAAKIPAHEFSPAEIQGYLLKNKRDPEKAVEGAEDWVVATRKEKKEKELREAEERRAKAEKERKEKEEKEKEKKKEKGRKKASKKTKKRRKETDSEGDSSTSGSSSAESDASESERKSKERLKKKRSPAASASTSASSAEGGIGDASAPVRPGKEGEIAGSEAKTQPDHVVPAITIDAAKAKAAERPLQTPGVDSGYGSPYEKNVEGGKGEDGGRDQGSRAE
ncbi:hypothetical protein VTH82DRAFT_7325 [Thermothelomyces myriococcoides]